VVLGVIGWGSVQLFGVFGSGGSGHNAAAGHCASGGTVGTKAGATAGASPSAVPDPSAVTVNVYNATDRDGLAARTADALKKRGFRIGKVGNATDQYDHKVTGTAILLGGPQAQSALKVLGTQVAAGTIKTDAKRAGATDVDLIIGKGFAALDPASNASRALAVLKRPVPDPSASDCPAAARKQTT
jgi:hypothetical protein